MNRQVRTKAWYSRLVDSRGFLLVLGFLQACSSRPSQEPSKIVEADPCVEDSAKINESRAKELVLMSYKKVFSSLYLQNDVDKKFFHPGRVYPEELNVIELDPNVFKVSNSRLAGLYFEAWVDRSSGFVEWIDIGFASE